MKDCLIIVNPPILIWMRTIHLYQDFPYWESSGSMGSPNEMMA